MSAAGLLQRLGVWALGMLRGLDQARGATSPPRRERRPTILHEPHVPRHPTRRRCREPLAIPVRRQRDEVKALWMTLDYPLRGLPDRSRRA